ncbi:MAG: glycoside hydrolase family 3 C-terminal domain-containing protein [Bacteroidales bacterium]|nr:glycoside hydrolase family 3 C-terminal domain-containing protein [Bacteroidales bacterium]
MKPHDLIVLAALFTAGTLQAQTLPVYLDESKTIEERVDDALSRMTLNEKIAIIHAQSKFSSPGVGRLGIPELWCTDGPHGIRPDVLWDEWEQAGCSNDSCTAFPALTCLAATWNTDLALRYGQSIGEEARYRNKSVLLGPGVNICRTPLNGRSFEYMGEDPYLSGRMGVGYVKGVQQQGVAVCVKHYALNNNEHERYTSNAICDERTLREIYLPAFEAAIREGGAWTLMGGYNLFRGQHACHNQYLMNEILKGEWGFDGAIISDWGGTQSTEEAIYNGLDLEFGTWTDGLSMGATNAYDNYLMANPYRQLILDGKVGEKELNDKVRRVLRLIFRTTMNRNRGFGSINSEAHIQLAQQVGAEGIVLLKNDPTVPKTPIVVPYNMTHGEELVTLLPIQINKLENLLVVGENAIKMMTVGGGSSSLKAQHEIVPLDGIKARLAGTHVDVNYARGYVGDPGGSYNGVSTGQDLNDSRSAEELRDEAVRMAGEADVVIFIGGLNKSGGQDNEGTDRADYALPYGQDELIKALVKANPRLIVVNISGNAVAMPWINDVPAVLQDWYLGSEAGTSLAQVLFGDVNPSGHLPMTWYASLDQCAVHAPVLKQGRQRVADPRRYPGIERQDSTVHLWDIYYDEGLEVGYRYVDRQKFQPLFPFGYGLSYTTFTMHDAAVVDATPGAVKVKVSVTNTGSRAGAEVVQLYVQDVKSSVARPLKELKAFQKVFLQPGETKVVTLTLNDRAFQFYDVAASDWRAEPGRFNFLIGNSSKNILQTLAYDLK